MISFNKLFLVLTPFKRVLYRSTRYPYLKCKPINVITKHLREDLVSRKSLGPEHVIYK